MKVAIVTDSSSGLSIAQEKEMGIHVLRMPLTIDDETYIEAKEIDRETVIEKLRGGSTILTSQPNIQEAVDCFNSLLKEHDSVIYLPISKHLSGSYDTANLIKQEVDGDLVVVDTEFVSWPLAQMALDAKALCEKGHHPEEVKDILENKAYMYAALIPEDINHLKNGGRIKPAAAAVANLLKIIPVLEVEKDGIDLYDKVRTNRKALLRGFERVMEHGPYEDYHWVILNGGVDDDLIEAIRTDMIDKTGQPVYKGVISPIVMGHTGPGTIGFGVIKKIEELK